MRKVVLDGETVELPDWKDRIAAFDRRQSKRDAEHLRWIMSMSPEERRKRSDDIIAEAESHYKGSKERLAYYRSHGLSDCSDYPGGDRAFERDVLSGEQREEKGFHFEFKNEDAYIYKCIENGRFKVDREFGLSFHIHPRIQLLADDVLGFVSQGPYNYRQRILSPDSDLYVKQ